MIGRLIITLLILIGCAHPQTESQDKSTVVETPNASSSAPVDDIARERLPTFAELEAWHRNSEYRRLADRYTTSQGELKNTEYLRSHWEWYYVGFAMLQVGRYENAVKALRRSHAADPKFFPAIYNLACTAARMGNKDETIELLKLLAGKVRNSEQARSRYLTYIKNDADLASIRLDQRYSDVLRLYGK